MMVSFPVRVNQPRLGCAFSEPVARSASGGIACSHRPNGFLYPSFDRHIGRSGHVYLCKKPIRTQRELWMGPCAARSGTALRASCSEDASVLPICPIPSSDSDRVSESAQSAAHSALQKVRGLGSPPRPAFRVPPVRPIRVVQALDQSRFVTQLVADSDVLLSHASVFTVISPSPPPSSPALPSPSRSSTERRALRKPGLIGRACCDKFLV